VVHTLQAESEVKVVWTVAVSIALALLLALFPDITKVTLTDIWPDTRSIHTLTMAVGFTFSTVKKKTFNI
jgi:hypothetical protein